MRKQLIFWIFLSVILSANEEKLVDKSKKDSPSIYAAENKEANTQIQTMVKGEDYFIVTYKADEFFVDDLISKQLKDFLAKGKAKNPNLQVNISSFDIQDQLSATIS